MCFIVNLLWSIVILQTVSYFVVFALIFQIIMFDRSESSNKIMFIISMLQIWIFKYVGISNLTYFRSYWIFKYVGHELILFLLIWMC